MQAPNRQTTSLLTLTPIDPDRLDSFAKTHFKGSDFLQHASWGRVQESLAKTVYYLGLKNQAGQLVGTAVVFEHHAKRAHYFEIPGGPLLDWQDINLSSQFVLALKDFARAHGVSFVRIRPNLPTNPNLKNTFKRLGFRPAPMPLHAPSTVMIDLEKNESELLTDMRRQTRYLVRQAQKKGIVVSVEEGEAALKVFYALQRHTAKRQHFVQSSQAEITAIKRTLRTNAKLYFAKLNDQILAAGLVLFLAPEGIYLEAASTPAGHKYPGAYALIWQAMRDLKAAGFKRFNLFGIAPPNSPKHRFAGVTTFKTGFGGKVINYLPAYDLVLKPLPYLPNYLLESIRRIRRHL